MSVYLRVLFCVCVLCVCMVVVAHECLRAAPQPLLSFLPNLSIDPYHSPLAPHRTTARNEGILIHKNLTSANGLPGGLSWALEEPGQYEGTHWQLFTSQQCSQTMSHHRSSLGLSSIPELFVRVSFRQHR